MNSPPRRLVLIKHARPEPQDGVPPGDWPLSAEGRAAADRLAAHIARLALRDPRLFSSPQRKAVESAAALDLPIETLPDLREHDREDVPLMRPGDYISTMQLLFREPRRLVMGLETAASAADRFAAAVGHALASSEGDVIVVSHGTVLALWLADHLGQPAFMRWRQMGQPAYVVVEVPSMTQLMQVDHVD